MIAITTQTSVPDPGGYVAVVVVVGPVTAVVPATVVVAVVATIVVVGPATVVVGVVVVVAVYSRVSRVSFFHAL